MQIYKFGGASVRSPLTIRNLKEIVSMNKGELIIVVSAMGKTTQNLEELLKEYFKAWFDIKDSFTNISRLQKDKLIATQENWDKNKQQVFDKLDEIKKYHADIIAELVFEKENLAKIDRFFIELKQILEIEPSYNYDYEYDKIVSFGELISTRIISAFFNENGLNNKWKDIRKGIKTGNFYRDAQVNWDLTAELCKSIFVFENYKIFVTQGFIGSTLNNHTTTLGREGSDFSASILAYVLNAENVTIWKDVDGVYSGDPKQFSDVELLEKISYQEAIEQTYYGASVIHPKTIKPLQNKKIPLYVKSFESPELPGTLIHSYDKWNRGSITKDVIPVYILKKNQVLIRIIPFDYSFIAEDNLSKIFAIFAKYRIRVNLMQNTAISFSACFDNDPVKVPAVVDEIKQVFDYEFESEFELLTVRHFDDTMVNEIIGNREIVIEEKNRTTARFLIK
jgi:aspartate kinase